MSSLCSLPREVRCYLFEWVDRWDQRNVVPCNRTCYEDMTEVIYKDIQVEQKYLKHDISNKLQHFKHTNKLTIGGDFEGPHEETDYEKFNFALIINSCDSDRLTEITFDIFIVPDTFRFVSEKLRNIQCLRFVFVEVGNLPWEKLSSFRALKKLQLQEVNITQGDIKSICQAAPQLQGLDLERSRNFEECHQYLSYIGGLDELNRLRVGHNDCLADSFHYNLIAGLQKLEHLDVSYSKIDDSFVKKVVRSSPNIKHLGIGGTGVTDGGVGSISKLQHLRHLDLSDCEITDNGLRHVARIVTLKTLILFRCHQLTDNGLIHLPNLKLLENLDLNQVYDITDRGVSYVSTMMTLRKLKLEECIELTDKALELIGKLSFIGKLNLSGNDNYTEDGLKHLARLRFLHTVYFMGGNITEEEMTRAGLNPQIALL